MKKEFFKIKKRINWRRVEGCFILLHPYEKRLFFYNKNISNSVSNDGFFILNKYTQNLIKKLSSCDIIRKVEQPAHCLDYTVKKLTSPLNVTIQITNRCNLNCIHCHRNFKNTKDLGLGSFKKIIKELRSLNVFNINVSGGEPILVAQLPEMIKAVDDFGMKVTMSTNGLLLTKKLASFYKRAGLSSIQISIDSANPSRHNAIRGMQNAYGILAEKIKILKKLEIDFVVVTTLINQSLEEYSRVIDLAYRAGASAHKTNTTVPQGEGRKLGRGFLPMREYKKVWIKKVKEYEGLMPVLAETMFAIQLGKRYISPPKIFNLLKIGCPAGILTANINEYGEVNPCPFFPDMVFGNIKKNSFKKIWCSKAADMFRDRTLIRGCGKCENRNVCGGCRARSFGIFARLNEKDPACFRLKI